MPFQGSAADLIKLAMVHLYHQIMTEHLPCHMLLQIHDELLFEIPENAVEEMLPRIIETMENVWHVGASHCRGRPGARGLRHIKKDVYHNARDDPQDPGIGQRSIRAVSIAFRMVFNRSLDAAWGSAVPLALPHSAQALGQWPRHVSRSVGSL